MFIKHHALVEAEDIKNITPLAKKKSLDRLPFVACVVKECKPNDLGDMLITVKGSVHNKVLKDAKFGIDIGVGSVLLLKEVKASMPVVRLNYVVKPTIQPNVDSNVQRNENQNQSLVMEVNFQANVDPNVQPTMQPKLILCTFVSTQTFVSKTTKLDKVCNNPKM
ncbi:hypothetical protein DEO72_LG7g1053 [Vigna unguiculata]|uniref:Uncharacterized protein n=1 Tax=Vigna unguiculata TaxID=3917 RepID=A0A4D6MFI2_VIGUN|nr:hypothetical protein DEO72_LG7g1053 [Vigna unguiculata]